MKLSHITKTSYRDFALYTLENRAIPQFADGFKPVHRFLFYQGLKMCKTKFDKVAAVGSSVSAAGYHHSEASAQSALTLMAADYCNNISLFDGDGNFGSKLDPAAAAARYIFVKINPIVDKIFLDMDLCPAHEDPEHLPPAYYLPIIPMFLVNGIKGIATGFATDIPPMDPIVIIDYLLSKAKAGINKQQILPKYPGFSGKVTREGNSFILEGKFERPSGTKLVITEIPYGYNSESYEAVLEKLQDKNLIVDYDNLSVGDSFRYEVTLKRTVHYTNDDIIKHFKLRSTHTWNLTTISPNFTLQEWNPDTGFIDILNKFYEFRLPFVATRIRNKIVELNAEIAYLTAFIKFCTDVISGKFSFKITDEEFEATLLSDYLMPKDKIQKTMNTPVRSFTTKNMDVSRMHLDELSKELGYYLNTTPENEFSCDLETLKKSLIKRES